MVILVVNWYYQFQYSKMPLQISDVYRNGLRKMTKQKLCYFIRPNNFPPSLYFPQQPPADGPRTLSVGLPPGRVPPFPAGPLQVPAGATRGVGFHDCLLCLQVRRLSCIVFYHCTVRFSAAVFFIFLEKLYFN